MKLCTINIARLLRFASALAVVATLAACSGGSGSGTAGTSSASCVPSDPITADECGNVLIAVTDADGDFVSYAVDVLAITLQRSDGATVETLPAATRIDFADLTEFSELLSTAALAPGDIAGGSIRLDYSSAEIFVESGGDIVPAIAVDESGAALGVIDLEIRLADREHLVITRGRNAFLSIDFDLAASHEADLGVAPARITTRPYLVAEIRPLIEKQLRARGALVDVDFANSSYDIRVRPWHHRNGDFGIVTVHTTPATAFEIGGAGYSGTPGLEALATLEPGALTVAFGTLDIQERLFTAEIVHAGDSVGGDRFAAIHGNVVARSGDTLTVKGAIAVHRDRPAHFHRTVLVEIGADTRVSKVGDLQATLDKDAISVGQRIVAFGEFTNAEVATADPLAPDAALILDATQGRVRMLVTHLHGSVTSIMPGRLTLQLRAIDRLGIELFSFDGTGVNAMSDADPLEYEVETGTLSLDGLEIGKWARVFGFVAPFGGAPPDFFGRTIVDHRDIPAALGIGWGITGTSSPFSTMGPANLALNMDDEHIGVRHHLLLGRRLVDLFDLPGVPAIAPTEGRGLYGLWEPGHVELFADFADFVDELSLRLGGGAKAHSLAAYGAYDESAITVTAHRVVVHLSPAP